jgi:flagellar hook assembly protein FlgD
MNQKFDISGRLVKTLANEEMERGTHEIKWTVNDENGNTYHQEFIY